MSFISTVGQPHSEDSFHIFYSVSELVRIRNDFLTCAATYRHPAQIGHPPEKMGPQLLIRSGTNRARTCDLLRVNFTLVFACQPFSISRLEQTRKKVEQNGNHSNQSSNRGNQWQPELLGLKPNFTMAFVIANQSNCGDVVHSFQSNLNPASKIR